RDVLRPRLPALSALRVALAVALAIALGAGPAAHAAVRYRVTLDERTAHRATVEMTVTGVTAGALELWMPVWTPGAYELRTWGRNVTPLDADDGDGHPLGVARTGASTFRVDGASAGGTVRVRYRVYAAKLTDDGSHVDGGHALIN